MDPIASPPLLHLPDSALSLFQSAVAAADQRFTAKTDRNATQGTPPPVDHGSVMLQATARAALARAAGAPAAEAPLPQDDAAKTPEQCAKLYLARALAEASGDQAKIDIAQRALPPFGTCDGRWIEALNEFLLHYTLRRQSDVPYRKWKDLGDFVLPDALPDTAKVAVIGDWGTGDARAQALMKCVATFQPDIVIHLGDIYYSCDLREANAFYDNIRSVFPETSPRIFTLCGNHDMYSGATPYYALLARLDQPASFFCLRNAHWQFLAMDTGYNDFNPFAEQRAATWLRDGTDDEGREADDPYSELEWHEDKFANAGGRKTIFLSHHPLFTRSSPIAGNQVCNTRLLAQVKPVLDKVTLWLWGHEHCQLIYAPFSGLERGRCLGAGAIPTLPSDDPYDASANFAAGQTPPGLLGDPKSRLGIDEATGWHDLGFAMLELNGATAKATYYGFNQTAGARVLYEEQLP